MPYIAEEDRDTIEYELSLLISRIHEEFDDNERDGVLNYCVSRLVSGVLRPETGWRYRIVARAIAVFECAKLEFYRRVAAPYEDLAISKNADIPEYKYSHIPKAAQACQLPKPTE